MLPITANAESKATEIIIRGKVVASGTNQDGDLRMTVIFNKNIYFCLHTRLPAMSLGASDLVSIECHRTNYDDGELIK